jgi:hypothetical protein
LRLSEEQRRIAEEEFFAGPERYRGPFDYSSPMREEELERVAEILKPEQLRRLKEIGVQCRGTGVLYDEELGATDEQRREMGRQCAKRSEELLAIQRCLLIAGHQPIVESPADARKERQRSMQDMLKILTPEQREKFGKMRGKEIDLDLTPLEAAAKRARAERAAAIKAMNDARSGAK